VNFHGELRELLDRAGAFERQQGYYAVVVLACLILLAGCLYGFTLVTSPALLFLNAAFYGFVTIQLGLVMHDAGHHEIFQTPLKNDLMGLFAGDLLSGLCYGWWELDHNRHHTDPNRLDKDPALSMLQAVFALTEEEARTRLGVKRVAVRFQAYLLPFVAPFQIFALKFSGIRFLVYERSRWRGLETFLLVVHYAAYIWFLICWLGPWRGLVVSIVQHLVGGGYLATIFAPNHMGMRIIDPSEPVDPFLNQVEPSRNVATPKALEFLWGSLNHQIEHHLFPVMSRNQIRRVRPIVRQFCLERGIVYHELSFLECYREIFRDLHRISAAVRSPGRTGGPRIDAEGVLK
jgi:fatty acid desaturase